MNDVRKLYTLILFSFFTLTLFSCSKDDSCSGDVVCKECDNDPQGNPVGVLCGDDLELFEGYVTCHCY